MRLTDLLALSHVPRWSIVAHSRPQSVADHTFRVMVIALELCSRMNLTMTAGLYRAILCHDAPESRTADIPNPAKTKMFGTGGPEWLKTIDDRFCPWMKDEPSLGGIESQILHLADKIEGYTFIVRNGVGPHATSVAKKSYEDFRVDLGMCDPGLTPIVYHIIDQILSEWGRVDW